MPLVRSKKWRWRIKLNPVLSLYREKSGGDFVILNYAVDPRIGASLGWGDLIRVNANKFRLEGIRILLENLLDFAHRNVRDPSVWFKQSEEDEEAFHRSHDLIQINLIGVKTLQLSPMRRATEGGFTGDPKDARNISTQITSEEFWEILEATFAMCAR